MPASSPSCSFSSSPITDYYDGKLARTHGMVTDLGKLLDPIADKLLLLATFIPMFILVGSRQLALALVAGPGERRERSDHRRRARAARVRTTSFPTSRQSVCSGCRGGSSRSCSDARRS